MAACPAFDPAAPYVRGVVDFVDCHAVDLAQQGYRALGAGSHFAMALQALIVIAVALAGYRMLLGGLFGLREGVSLVLRIGLVLALALNWPAYQPLVYDLATSGPQDLLTATATPGGTGAQDRSGLIDRVQGVDTVLGGILHVEAEPPAGAVTGIATTATNRRTATADTFGQTPELAPETRELLASANSFVVLGSLAGLVSIRVVMAIMLALGPLFVAGLLFESARGLFVGWLRVLLGAALAAFAVPVALALALALLEPQAAALSRQFYNGLALGTLPERIWDTAVLAGLVVCAALVASFWAAAALRLPEGLRRELRALADPLVVVRGTGDQRLALPPPAPAPRSHAQAIADAAYTAQRREQAAVREVQATRQITPHDAPLGGRAPAPAPVRIGQAGRAGLGRQSTAASRRDMMA